jgi:hypothetical protein
MKNSKLAIAALVVSCIGATISIIKFITYVMKMKSEETDRILEPDYVDPEEFDFEAGEIYNQDEEEEDENE